MVKGVASRRLLTVNLSEDLPLFFSPAAAVTTYAAAGISAAGASASAGFGGLAAMTARRAGTAPLLFTTPMTVNATSDMGAIWLGLSSRRCSPGPTPAGW
jgi:hypothetical protein